MKNVITQIIMRGGYKMLEKIALIIMGVVMLSIAYVSIAIGMVR